MENLNLDTLGVKELNDAEISGTNGGIIVVMGVIGAVAGIYCAVLACAYNKGYYDGVKDRESLES